MATKILTKEQLDECFSDQLPEKLINNLNEDLVNAYEESAKKLAFHVGKYNLRLNQCKELMKELNEAGYKYVYNQTIFSKSWDDKRHWFNNGFTTKVTDEILIIQLKEDEHEEEA